MVKNVLYFSSKWCKNCKIIEAIINNLIVEYNELSFFKYDVDIDIDEAEKFNIASLPTFIFMNNDNIQYEYTGSDIDELTIQIINFHNNDSSLITNSNKEVEEEIIWPRFFTISESNKVIVDIIPPVNINSTNINDILTSQIEINNCDINKLFIYKIPIISKNGTCSNSNIMSPNPFNLATNVYKIDKNIDLRNHQKTQYLNRLYTVVELLYSCTQADWIGIYRMMDTVCANGITIPALVKESYKGAASRPVFPVTQAWSDVSTNSWVALTGKVRHIINTRQRDEGVSYYECNGNVQSEICVPILKQIEASKYVVIGIIDIESWNLNHFTPDLVEKIIEISYALGKYLQFEL